MITMYLSSRSLEAARAVDPYVSPAAVHAAVEIAVAEQLRAPRTGSRRDPCLGRRDRAPDGDRTDSGNAAGPGERDPVRRPVDAALSPRR